MALPTSAQTFLFVPGNRPDRFDKALAAGADMVVFDLEDAVPADEKETARAYVAQALRDTEQSVMVRVNGVDTPWHALDARTAIAAEAHIMLPKTETPGTVEALGIPAGSPVTVVALIETPVGMLEAAAIAQAPSVVRLAFGSLDFAAALGVSPESREALSAARAHLVLASAAAQLAGPVDGVTVAVRDPEALITDASYAKALGFTGKLCIHPAQLDATARVFTPTAEEVAWATSVLHAATDAASHEGGVVVVDGKMIDAPVLKRARSIVSAQRRQD